MSVKHFQEKETLLQNMTFMAMIAGIDALLSLFAALFPLSALFLMLLIPLSATIVSLYCKARYLPIFLVATLGVCIAVSAWNFQSTLFYVLPGLITGVAYGLFWKKGFPPSLSLFLVSLLQFGLFYFSLYLVEWIYGVNMPSFLLGLIGQGENPYAKEIFPLFGFAYCLATVSLSHLFALTQLERLHQETPKEDLPFFVLPAAAMATAAISFGLGFVLPWLSYLFLGFAIYFAAWCAVSFYPNPKVLALVLLGILVVASLFLFAALYPHRQANQGLTMLSLLPFSLGVAAIINSLLSKKKEGQ